MFRSEETYKISGSNALKTPARQENVIVIPFEEIAAQSQVANRTNRSAVAAKSRVKCQHSRRSQLRESLKQRVQESETYQDYQAGGLRGKSRAVPKSQLALAAGLYSLLSILVLYIQI